MHSPPRLNKPRTKRLIKSPIKSQQQKAKQKLIQFSQMQQTAITTQPYQLFSSLLDSKTRSNKNITQSSQHQKVFSCFFGLNKNIKSVTTAKNTEDGNGILKQKCRSVKSERNYKSENKQSDYLIRQPISINNYFMTGSKSMQRKNLTKSAPKSQYIIRQRRNSKKVQRNQQKRQTQQSKARNSLFDKLVSEREIQKNLNMKSILLANKYKKYIGYSLLQQK